MAGLIKLAKLAKAAPVLAQQRLHHKRADCHTTKHLTLRPGSRHSVSLFFKVSA